MLTASNGILLMGNVATELAKQRNHAAAERTLLSWSDSSFKLLGLGILIDRVFAALTKAFSKGVGVASPLENRIVSEQVSSLLSLSIILLGLGLLALGIREYKIATRSIQHKDYLLPSSRPMALAATTGVVLFGIIAVVFILLRSL